LNLILFDQSFVEQDSPIRRIPVIVGGWIRFDVWSQGTGIRRLLADCTIVNQQKCARQGDHGVHGDAGTLVGEMRFHAIGFSWRNQTANAFADLRIVRPIKFGRVVSIAELGMIDLIRFAPQQTEQSALAPNFSGNLSKP
jgi:hypothetical protein